MSSVEPWSKIDDPEEELHLNLSPLIGIPEIDRSHSLSDSLVMNDAD